VFVEVVSLRISSQDPPHVSSIILFARAFPSAASTG
jgi:hypothetical protein